MTFIFTLSDFSTSVGWKLSWVTCEVKFTGAIFVMSTCWGCIILGGWTDLPHGLGVPAQQFLKLKTCLILVAFASPYKIPSRSWPYTLHSSSGVVLIGSNTHFPRGYLLMCRGLGGCHDEVTSLDAKYPTLWVLVPINTELHIPQS